MLGRRASQPTRIDWWAASSFAFALLLLAPLLAVFFGIFEESQEWPHLARTVLPGYLLNTLILISGVGVLSACFAIPTAWLIATYEFPGRRFWQWALVMPLAVPTFASAFTYFDVLEFSIPLLVEVREVWGIEVMQWVERIIRYGTLITLLSGVLYPYLFILLRTTFEGQQSVYFEAGRVLGKSPRSIFRSIALPLARPALIAGLSLITMEVISDYGAVNFFGVPTLTEGIFRTWFGLGDRVSGLRLAAMVVALVFVVLWLESWQRKRQRYAESSQSSRPHRRLSPNRLGSIFAVVSCALPVLIGFAYPVSRLVSWAMIAGEDFDYSRFFEQIMSSLLLAASSALVITFLAFFLAFCASIQTGRLLPKWIQASTLGYAIPSVVTGVGVMVLFGRIDRFSHLSGFSLVLSGTLIAIGFAYAVRFMTVAYKPLGAAMDSVCGSLHEASRMLRRGRWSSLMKIHFPLLKLNMLACATLVFIDISKELPLTLVLRPSGFETLATFAFGFAKEGQIYDCAFPSLLITMLGVCGLLFINRWIQETTEHDT